MMALWLTLIAHLAPDPLKTAEFFQKAGPERDPISPAGRTGCFIHALLSFSMHMGGR